VTQLLSRGAISIVVLAAVVSTGIAFGSGSGADRDPGALYAPHRDESGFFNPWSRYVRPSLWSVIRWKALDRPTQERARVISGRDGTDERVRIMAIGERWKVPERPVVASSLDASPRETSPLDPSTSQSKQEN